MIQHTTISRIHLHGLVSTDSFQRGAGPFPKATHLTKTCELVPLLSDWNRMPAFEANIGVFKIGEEGIRVRTSCDVAGRTVRQMLGWWSLLDALVDEMAVNGGDRSTEGFRGFFLLQRIGIVVDAAPVLAYQRSVSGRLAPGICSLA